MNLKKIANAINITEQLAGVALKVSQILKKNNIPFAIIEGIAVGAHSKRARTTQDVDFVIPEKDLEKIEVLFGPGKPLFLSTNEPGLTVIVDDVEVDFIGNNFSSYYKENVEYNGLTVPSVFSIMFMKLRAGRSKDSTDVIEIIKKMPKELRKTFVSFLKQSEKEIDFDYEMMKEDFESLCQIADLEDAAEEKKLPNRKASQEYRKFLFNKALKKNS